MTVQELIDQLMQCPKEFQVEFMDSEDVGEITINPEWQIVVLSGPE